MFILINNFFFSNSTSWPDIFNSICNDKLLKSRLVHCTHRRHLTEEEELLGALFDTNIDLHSSVSRAGLVVFP